MNTEIYLFDTSSLIGLGKINERLLKDPTGKFKSLVQKKRAFIIRNVKQELERGITKNENEEKIPEFLKDNIDKILFPLDQEVQKILLSEILTKYYKEDIAYANDPKIADPYLIALAKYKGFTLVTDEKLNISDSTDHVKIPNVCLKENVKCISLVSLIQQEQWGNTELGISYSNKKNPNELF